MELYTSFRTANEASDFADRHHGLIAQGTDVLLLDNAQEAVAKSGAQVSTAIVSAPIQTPAPAPFTESELAGLKKLLAMVASASQ